MEAIATITSAIAEGGGLVTLLFLLIREQQRHDTLIRVLIRRTEGKGGGDSETE